MEEQDGGTLVVLAGELDMTEVDALEVELRRIEAANPELVVIDLSQLTLIDSHGLSALLDADARGRSEGRRIVLIPPPDAIMHVFRITLLDRRFEWADPRSPELRQDFAEALLRLRSQAATAS
jgi:anti-sigma B factor antagonist